MKNKEGKGETLAFKTEINSELPDYIVETDDKDNYNNVVLSFKKTKNAKSPTKINFSITWEDTNIYTKTGNNKTNKLEKENIKLPNDAIIQISDGKTFNDLYITSSNFNYSIIDLPVGGGLSQKSPDNFNNVEFPIFPLKHPVRGWSSDGLHYVNSEAANNGDVHLPTCQDLGNNFTYQIELPVNDNILSYENINDNNALANEVRKQISQVAYKQGNGSYSLEDTKNGIPFQSLTNGKYSSGYNFSFDHIPISDIHVTVTDTTPKSAPTGGEKTKYIAKKIYVQIDGIKNPVFGYQDINAEYTDGTFPFINFKIKHPGTALPDGVTNYHNDNGDFSDKATNEFFKNNLYYLTATTNEGKVKTFNDRLHPYSFPRGGLSGSGWINAQVINQPCNF